MNLLVPLGFRPLTLRVVTGTGRERQREDSLLCRKWAVAVQRYGIRSVQCASHIQAPYGERTRGLEELNLP